VKRSSSKRDSGGAKRAANKRRHARLVPEERSVRHRLSAAVAPSVSGPVLGRANIVYELAERTRAVSHGGMGVVAKLVKSLDVASEVDSSLQLLKSHRPYHESDHVLNVAYNALCGGRTLDDIEARRTDEVFLDGIGASALPDPTTAGDFCSFQQSTPHLDEPKPPFLVMAQRRRGPTVGSPRRVHVCRT
jgi:hypothetical protein